MSAKVKIGAAILERLGTMVSRKAVQAEAPAIAGLLEDVATKATRETLEQRLAALAARERQLISTVQSRASRRRAATLAEKRALEMTGGRPSISLFDERGPGLAALLKADRVRGSQVLSERLTEQFARKKIGDSTISRIEVLQIAEGSTIDAGKVPVRVFVTTAKGNQGIRGAVLDTRTSKLRVSSQPYSKSGAAQGSVRGEARQFVVPMDLVDDVVVPTQAGTGPKLTVLDEMKNSLRLRPDERTFGTASTPQNLQNLLREDVKAPAQKLKAVRQERKTLEDEVRNLYAAKPGAGGGGPGAAVPPAAGAGGEGLWASNKKWIKENKGKAALAGGIGGIAGFVAPGMIAGLIEDRRQNQTSGDTLASMIENAADQRLQMIRTYAAMRRIQAGASQSLLQLAMQNPHTFQEMAAGRRLAPGVQVLGGDPMARMQRLAEVGAMMSSGSVDQYTMPDADQALAGYFGP